MTDLLRPTPQVQRPRPRIKARRSTAFQVVVIGAIAYLGAALLNSGHLVRTAQRQPFGARRDLYLAALKPLDRVSRALHLDQPARAVSDIRGERNVAIASAASKPTPTAIKPIPGSVAIVAPIAESTPIATLGARGSAAISAPTTVSAAGKTLVIDPAGVADLWVPRFAAAAMASLELRSPVPGRPLELWVGGDSLGVGLGAALTRLTGDQSLLAAASDARISSGLTRPDYFDWPGEIARTIATRRPDVIVVMFGANDAQPIAIGDRSYSIDAPEWQAEYRRRVDSVIGVAEQARVRLIWVGQPAMRASDFDRKMGLLDSIYAQETAGRAFVTYVDSRSLFGSTYNAFLTAVDGGALKVRTPDGVHLTNTGYEHLARAVLDVVQRETAPADPVPPLPPITPL